MTGLETWVAGFTDACTEKIPEVNVYHIEKAPEAETKVICWQEISSTSYYGDDHAVATILQLQIDYFTDQEFDTNPSQIASILDDLGLFKTMEGIDFDADRDQWRYIWTAGAWVKTDA